MQTFLPYPSLTHSVSVLDYRRLGKQRVECSQILSALFGRAACPNDTVPGWGRHPATLMWAGHESALAVYMTLCIREWTLRGYKNNMVAPYRDDWTLSPAWERPCLERDARRATVPWWLGRQEFHLSHQRALLQKDPEWYRQWGWRVVPRLDYWWPTEHESERDTELAL